MALTKLQDLFTVYQLVGFLLYSMFRYISCLESYWKDFTALRNYLPDSDYALSTTIAPNMFACMNYCSMTDGCCFISYIAITSVCTRYRVLKGYQPRNSSSFWNLLKDDGCPCGWYGVDSSCFIFTEVALSWQDSVTYCKVLDARLAEVDSVPKAALIQSVATARTDFRIFWLGGTDSAKENAWVWTTSGSPIKYGNWYPKEPDNWGEHGFNSDCACMGDWTGYLWDDCDCSQTYSPICERTDIYRN